MSGLPAFPTAAMRPPFKPTSALTIPQWSRISALVITVSTVKVVDRFHQRIDAPRRVVILPQAVAEAQLVHAILDRGEVAWQPRAQGIEIHHDEHAVDIGIGAEGVNGQAERSIVDETAIPMRHALDLGPRKSRRQAAARQ